MNPSKDPAPQTLDGILLRAFDKGYEASRQVVGLADEHFIKHQEVMIAEAKAALTTLIAERERLAQTNAVAWTIGMIDEMHMNGSWQTTSDSTFKGIKNTLRDRYKTETGIDPAPSYPVKAQLAPPAQPDSSKTGER